MKRKITALVLCAAVATATLCCFSACGNGAPRYKVPDGLQSEDYADYAKTADVNLTDYPMLADQGLTIVTSYGNGKTGAEADWTEITEVQADGKTADGKSNIEAYFDAEKPTVIIVHGVQFGLGRDYIEHMATENRTEEVAAGLDANPIDYFADEYGTYAGEINLGKYWNDLGYNVMYFHYERFADPKNSNTMNGSLGAVREVTDAIWSGDHVVACYKDADGNVQETENGKSFTGKYSVAEYYAAEYLRAFNEVDRLYPDYKNSDNEIVCAAHSMGGVVNVAGNLLLNLVAEDGQIDSGLNVDRLLQMDAYIGLSITELKLWNGKGYLEGNETTTYVEAMKVLVNRYDTGVAFYMNEGYAVPLLVGLVADFDSETKTFVNGEFADKINEMSEVLTFVLVRPYFAGVDSALTGGHNPIREWVLSSILYDAPTATDNGGVQYTVPTAKASKEELRKLKGKFFAMSEIDTPRSETMRCDDDLFEVWR